MSEEGAENISSQPPQLHSSTRKYAEFDKLRERESPTFANINLLGPCNVDCYFCLGKDIDSVWGSMNHLKVKPDDMPNLDTFLSICKDKGVQSVYVTGQNTDALAYRHLEELIGKIQGYGFRAGLRTNGYLWARNLDAIRRCDANPGFSIHTLNSEANWEIMRRRDIPDWDSLLKSIDHCRISIVINRHNVDEFFDLVKFISQYDSVKYIQARRICTDTREDFLIEDVHAYERLFAEVAATHPETRKFYGAECFELFGKEVTFWRTVKTSIGSLNYYSDGSFTDDYFVIEGYQHKGMAYPRLNDIPVAVRGLEGYWRER